MFEAIETKLRDFLVGFLPVLEKNHTKAEQEWKNGEMPKAVFEYISQRFIVSKVLLNRPDIKGELFLDIYAPLTIDIRTGILLLSENEQEVQNEKFKEWLACFDEVGFTDRQEIFDYPMKNLNNFDKKVKEIKENSAR